MSDINKRRKLQFGQATMLGVVVERAELRSGRAPWSFVLPPHLKPGRNVATGNHTGYISGYFARRWECVEAALRVLGVVG